MSYASLSDPRQVTTLNPHGCAWCNERIPAGTPGIWSRSYVWEGAARSDWMHPECYDAMGTLDMSEFPDGWMPGDWPRGGTDWPRQPTDAIIDGGA
jgi:hypothetical protein